jgi:hypothetical protein
MGWGVGVHTRGYDRRHSARRDGHVAADEYFFAEQNARLVMNAEQYYRSMLYGRGYPA